MKAPAPGFVSSVESASLPSLASGVPIAEAPSRPPASPPPEYGKPSVGALRCYAFGVIPVSLVNGIFQHLKFPVFNMILGVSPGLLGTISAAARVYDAFTDPLMAHVTDKTQTRWGRRRPFILLGGLLACALIGVMFWVQAGWSVNTILLWYAAISFLLATATTLFGVPYYALGIEMADDYDQRTRVVAYRSFVDKAMQVLGNWYFRFIELFQNSMVGARVLGFVAAILGAGACVAMVRKSRERPDVLLRAKRQKKEPFWICFRHVVQNRTYLRLLGVWAFMMINVGVFSALGNYLNVYYVFGGDKAAGATLTAITGSMSIALALAAIPGVMWASRRIGKHRVLMIALTFYVAGSLLKWVCITPENPYLQLVLPFFFAIGITSLFVIMSSMQADVVDLDELRHGTRHEGMFSAVGGWVLKLGGSLALLLSGWVIVWTGFDVALEGAQPDGVFFNMRVCFSLIPAGTSLFAFLLVHGYPLTRQRVGEIQAELAARRAAATAAGQ